MELTNIEPRKACSECSKPLIAFMGVYLHPAFPCSGIIDAKKIYISIIDEQLDKIFEELYGTPQINDYELLAKYEKELDRLKSEIDQLNRPIYKKFLDWLSNNKQK